MTVYTYPIGPLLTNCYIVTDSGSCPDALVIDPAFGDQKILDFLKNKGLRLAGVVLTHCHFDHMWALDGLCNEGVPFYCPAGDEPALTDPQKNASVLFGRDLIVKTPPTKLLKDGDVVSVGTESLNVLETPGHTEGSICLETDGILFSGDTLFCRGYGRTDLPGGSREQLFASLQRLLSLEEHLVYPGHGKETTISSEKGYFGL